jgi:hypothetical protein
MYRYTPHPDFWVAALWVKTMGTSSLNVTLVQPSPPAPPTPPTPPPGPPPFVPWVYSAHTTCVFGTPLNGDELTPLLGPLGSFKTEDECRSACESQPNCTIYTYGNATQGIWGRHACYGRHDDVWDPHGEPDFYCGRRVAVSPPQPLPPTSALRAYAHLSAHSRCVRSTRVRAHLHLFARHHARMHDATTV